MNEIYIKELKELTEMERVFTEELKKLHGLEEQMPKISKEQFAKNQLEVVDIVAQVAELLKKRG